MIPQAQSQATNQPQDSNKIHQNWLDPNCRYFNRVSVLKNSLAAKSNHVFAFGKEQIRGVFCLKVRLNLFSINIVLGIADSLDSTSQVLGKNRITYDCFDSLIANGQLIQSSSKPNGEKLKKGDIVKILVDLDRGIFLLYANNVQIICQKWNKLRDKTISWVPYLGMWSEKDSVSIIDMVNDIKVIFVELSLGLFYWDDDLLGDINSLIFHDGDVSAYHDL